MLMKSYTQMYKDASKGGAVKSLTPVYQEWQKPGDMIIGVFISKAAVNSSRGGEQYNQYVFQTDKGNVKFHMGRSADIDVADSLVAGVIYAITYNGKEDIGGGRAVNKFQVEEVGTVADVAPDPAEVS